MAFNKIILRHNVNAPTTATTAVTGEILVRHAQDGKDVALYTLRNDGKTFEAIPSKTYVDNAVSAVDNKLKETVVVGSTNITVTPSTDGNVTTYTVGAKDLLVKSDKTVLNTDKQNVATGNGTEAYLQVSSSTAATGTTYVVKGYNIANTSSVSAVAGRMDDAEGRLDTLEDFLYSGDTDNVIDKVSDIIQWFSGVTEETSGATKIINTVEKLDSALTGFDATNTVAKALSDKTDTGVTSALSDKVTAIEETLNGKDGKNGLVDEVVKKIKVNTTSSTTELVPSNNVIDLTSIVINCGTY